MKYEEFKIKVKELDDSLTISDEPEQIIIYLTEYFKLITISKECEHAVDDTWPRLMNYKNKKELLFLSWELKSTPLDEREGEQKYHYFLNYAYKRLSFINLDLVSRNIVYDSKFCGGGFKTAFTEKEYAELAKEKGIKEGTHGKEEVK